MGGYYIFRKLKPNFTRYYIIGERRIFLKFGKLLDVGSCSPDFLKATVANFLKINHNMKKHILSSLAILAAFSSWAQVIDYEGVPVVKDFIGHKISPDSKLIVGELGDGESSIVYNIETKKATAYIGSFFGNGNCTANNGVTVGQALNPKNNVEEASLMQDGKITIVPSLSGYGFSGLHGITPDATRACGQTANPNVMGDILDPAFNEVLYVPVYCDIDADGNFSEPVFLPMPEKDFFGAAPQWASAVWISEDGKTIAGQVLSNNGMYCYPIYYKESEDGTWNYFLPSESLFNTSGAEVPVYPEFTLKAPNPTDFMDEEQIAMWEQAYLDWEESGYDDGLDPYDPEILEQMMDPEQFDAYFNAVAEYNEAVKYYNDVLFPTYMAQLQEVVDSSIFFLQNALTMNPQGTLLATSRTIDIAMDGYMPIQNFQPFIFYIDGQEREESYKAYGTEEDRLITNQLLSDGTLICATPPPGNYSPDYTPVHSYLLLPGTDNFITLEEYLKNENTAWYDWTMDNLFKTVPVALDPAGGYVTKDLVVSGQIFTNDDLSIIGGGVDGYDIASDFPVFEGQLAGFFTYIFGSDDSGVDRLPVTGGNEGIFRVYNLQGIKMMETTDANAIISLPKGIYIVNGKKVKI